MWCSAELDDLSLQCFLGLPPTLTKVLHGWGLPASCSEQLFALENLSARRGLSSHSPTGLCTQQVLNRYAWGCRQGDKVGSLHGDTPGAD